MNETANCYSLSPLQKRSWVLNYQGRSSANVSALELEGLLRVEEVTIILERIIENHEIFRTSYVSLPDVFFPVQNINESSKLSLIFDDLSNLKEQEIQFKLNAIFCKLAGKKFDYNSDDTIHFELYKLKEDYHILYICSPCIASDTLTLNNVILEFKNHLFKVENIEEDYSSSYQFTQFSEWYNELLEEENVEALEFWEKRKTLRNLAVRPPFQPAYNSKSKKPEISSTLITGKEYDDLIKYIDNKHQDLSTFILSCWSVLQWYYSNQPEQFIIGKVESGRSFNELKTINGPIARSLPLLCKVAADFTIDEFYQKVEEDLKLVLKWQDYFNWPYQSLEENIYSFPIGFDFNDVGSRTYSNDTHSLKINTLYSDNDLFELKLGCINSDEGLELQVVSFSNNDDNVSSKCVNVQLLNIIRQFLRRPTTLIKDVLKVNEEEKEIVFQKFNRTDGNSSTPKTFIELFEEQVLNFPNKTALAYKEVRCTYNELNNRASNLAHLFVEEENVNAGDIIAVWMPRSENLVVSILGIMKSGATFLPIDENTPEERVNYILKDSNARLLLTDRKNKAKLNSSTRSLTIDDNSVLKRTASESLKFVRDPESTAYIIYTSGSTGNPKGVMVSNRSFVNYLEWFISNYNISESDSTLLFSSLAFDLSYTNVWSSLVSGSTLHILEHSDLFDPDSTIKTLVDEKITYIKLTPSQFSFITEDLNFETTINNYGIRLIVLGGEHLKTKDVEKYLLYHDKVQFVNHYGPTETTIGVIAKSILKESFGSFKQKPNIGKPIDKTRIYILNEDNTLSPVGVIGEICVGGQSVSKGYINREELTKQKFIENPFVPEEKLYKTGDLGKWLLDGQIELLGRNDSQVKILGYRVELGEIETTLLQYSGIIKAVVLLSSKDKEEASLVSYLEVENNRVKASEIQEYLKGKLPEYMVPSQFIIVEKIPLLANGKIDRKELKNIKNIELDSGFDFEAPKSETEKQLVDIWKKILLKEKIGVNDNFFFIGGNSLKLVKVFRELSKIFPNRLTLTDLFKYNTISALGSYLNETPDTKSIESFEF